MTDTRYLAHLFAYDSFMNRRVLELLRGLPETGERTRQVFAHLLQAKKLWMWRMRGQDYRSLKVWPELSWDDCAALIDENERDWREFIAGLSNDDLAREVTYTNSQGNEFSTAIGDILTHVLIHGGYHRGQIAAAVRDAGGEPINTDYIVFTRLSEAERTQAAG